MSQQNVFGLVDARRKKGRTALIRVELLHQGPVCLPNFISCGSRPEIQDLVGFVTGHHARWGLSIRMWRLLFPSASALLRKSAIEIGFEKANAVRIAGTALRQQIQ